MRKVNLPEHLVHPELGNIKIEYSAGRRNAAIAVKAVRGEVITSLRLPLCRNFSAETYLAFINKNLQWIKNKQKEISRQITIHTFEFGDKFLYLGKEYPLVHGRGSFFDGENFYVTTHSPALNKRELKKIYLSLAESFIVPLCRSYAEKFGLSVGNIKLKNVTARWGSCSAGGNINFAWNLIMCPEEFIRFIICHELAHRVHMNHSKEFHQTLKKFYPADEPEIEHWKYMSF